MKEIRILGEAGDQFGASFALDVRTPSEALRALDANFPGFLRHMDENNYRFLLMDVTNPDAAETSKLIGPTNKNDAWGDHEVLFILPSADGNPPVVAAIAYAAAYAASTVAISAGVTSLSTLMTIATVAYNVAYIAVTIGVSMAASAIASAVMGSDNGPSEFEKVESKPSYLFNGVANTARQGGRMPLLYGGPLLVGSMTLSARVVTEDVPV